MYHERAQKVPSNSATTNIWRNNSHCPRYGEIALSEAALLELRTFRYHTYRVKLQRPQMHSQCRREYAPTKILAWTMSLGVCSYAGAIIGMHAREYLAALLTSETIEFGGIA